MAEIGGMTYWELEFDAAGRLLADQGLLTEAGARNLRDLIIFSHGWNNSTGGARALYRTMIKLIVGQLPPERRATTGFAGVLWPARLFPEDAPAPAASTVGAELAEPGEYPPMAPSTGAELAGALAPAFPGQEEDLSRLGALLDEQPQVFEHLEEFHRLAAGLVTAPAQAPEDSGEQPVLSEPTELVLETMAELASPVGTEAFGGNLFDKLWRGAREVLRTLSYYEMKSRAGVVGKAGLGPFLARLRVAAPDLRVHLMGHSFGARLVAFGLAGLPETMPADQSPVKSLFLIQAAFSHFSFAPQLPFDPARPGTLAAVGHLVDGPLLATFSAADRAVGWWYPNASRLSRVNNELSVNNEFNDDLNFQWGGLGHDGFQQKGAIDVRMGPHGTRYDLQKGGFYRLDGNDVIRKDQSRFSGAHSDIRHPEVTWAAISAAGLTHRP